MKNLLYISLILFSCAQPATITQEQIDSLIAIRITQLQVETDQLITNKVSKAEQAIYDTIKIIYHYWGGREIRDSALVAECKEPVIKVYADKKHFDYWVFEKAERDTIFLDGCTINQVSGNIVIACNSISQDSVLKIIREQVKLKWE